MGNNFKTFGLRLRNEHKKKIVDILSLWVFQFTSVISAFITQLILAKELSLSEFGVLSTCLTIALIVSTFLSFGIGQSLVKIFGEQGDKGFQTTRFVMILLLILVITVLPVYLWFINNYNLFTNSSFILNLFTILILAQGLQPIVEGIYQLEGKYRKLSLIRFLVHFFRLLVVLILYFFKFTLIYVAIGYVVTSFILLIFYTRKIIKLLKNKIDLKGFNNSELIEGRENWFKKAFKETLPFALTSLFFLLYTQGNIFFVGLLLDEEKAGIFSVAFTIMNVIYLFPVTFYQSYLIPQIYRWSKKEKRLYINLYEIGGQSAFTIGIIIMILVSSLSIFIVPILFGDKYLNSAYVLIIMTLAIPLRLLSNNLGSILISGKAVSSKAYYQGIGVLINIIFNYIFIPKFGVNGAALSVIVTELFVTLFFIIGVKKHVNILKGNVIKRKSSYLFIYILSSSLVSMLLFKSYIINALWHNIILGITVTLLGIFLLFNIQKTKTNNIS